MKNFVYIIVPFISVIIAQIIKFIIESVKNKKINIERLLNGNGGMPSSHTSFTFSLAMCIGFKEGFDTSLFAISFIFACIVAYDAFNVRLESGKQAVAINLLVESIFGGNKKSSIKHLKEELGHKPMEVLMGVFLATLISFIFVVILKF